MFDAVVRLLFARPTESIRERHLSLEVDRLEYQLAMAKRETEAANIRLCQEREQFAQHRLKDYPASGKWVQTIDNLAIHGEEFQNPIEFVLSDVEDLGYDVSAAWMYLQALLTFIDQYQRKTLAAVQAMSSARAIKLDLSESPDAKIRVLQ